MKRIGFCLAAAMLVSCQSATQTAVAPALAAPPACFTPAAMDEVAATIRAFYAALAIDDDAALARVTTPNFYAFEIGKRFTRAELSKAIADAHASGRILQWNVGQVDARVDCNIAFAAWENTGASGPATKLEPRAWLESAVLLRQGGGWAIDFLHSSPKDQRK